MNSPRFPVPDAARSRLRATVATIEREIARLPEPIANIDGSSPSNGLAAAYADLVDQLALGPEPGQKPARKSCMESCWIGWRYDGTVRGGPVPPRFQTQPNIALIHAATRVPVRLALTLHEQS
jgi:hypothetical protein